MHSLPGVAAAANCHAVRVICNYTQGMKYSGGIRHTDMTVVTAPRKPKHVSVSIAAYVNDSKDFQMQDNLTT